jgi:hypothetical protein
MRDRSTSSFNWAGWVTWVLLTTLGWLAGWVFLTDLWMRLGGMLSLREAWIGLAIGVSQWVFLRSRLEKSYWWIIASMVGWAIGHLLVFKLLPVGLREWAGLPIGFTLGLAQWLLLRIEIPRAEWWLVISTLGWLLAMTGFLGGSLVGAVAGAVTGVAVVLFVDLKDAQELDEEHAG